MTTLWFPAKKISQNFSPNWKSSKPTEYRTEANNAQSNDLCPEEVHFDF